MVFRFLWPEHFFPPSWRHKCPAERKPGRLTCSEIALRTFFRVRSRLCAQKARCDSMICAVWRQQTQLVSSRVSGGKSSIVSRCSTTRRTHTRTGARPCAHINSARVSQCKSGWETRPGPAYEDDAIRKRLALDCFHMGSVFWLPAATKTTPKKSRFQPFVPTYDPSPHSFVSLRSAHQCCFSLFPSFRLSLRLFIPPSPLSNTFP